MGTSLKAEKTVRQRVEEIVRAFFSIPVTTRIIGHEDFFDDWGAGDLDLIYLSIDLAREFEIEIKDEDLQKVKVFVQLLDLIETIVACTKD